MVNNTKESDNDELMIVITPHVLANFNRSTPRNLDQRKVGSGLPAPTAGFRPNLQTLRSLSRS